MEFIVALFFVLLASVIGGFVAKFFKVPSLVGYILGGTLFGLLLPEHYKNVHDLAELGTILLLFSIGVELSFDKLSKFLKIAVIGGLIQILLVSGLSTLLLTVFGLSLIPALVLSLGFAMSSTAVVVKVLSDNGELETIHGGIMLGWLLVQDLAVIPVMILLPTLGNLSAEVLPTVFMSLLRAFLVVGATILLGKTITPFILHKVGDANSRELLMLTAVCLALGTAAATSFFGISTALGAFLAGVVISESQQHHAIFAETRPLRDLFVALFFVTLGFLINPQVLLTQLPLILIISLSILLIKTLVVGSISIFSGYKGRTAITSSFGLSQVGEFAFVIFTSAAALNLIGVKELNLGIGVTLITLLTAPILYKMSIPVWRRVKKYKMFSANEKSDTVSTDIANHIIICGYGRVGKWVGRALSDFNIPFVVVEYNQKIVQELKAKGVDVLYGDPTEPEVLEMVNIRNAKAVVVAIPDRIAQETLITYVQTVAPEVKIISRAHLDEDWEKLKTLRVDKIVQPEFEASVEIVRSILRGVGKSKDDIAASIKSLRVSHSK